MIVQKKWSLLTFQFLLACSLNYALEPTTPLGQYVLNHWDNRSGLPQNAVTAIAQTTEGYLWIGTQVGLARFDGVRFEQFRPATHASLIDGYIIALASGRDGSLWLQTPKGIQRYFRGHGSRHPPRQGSGHG